MKSQDFYKKNLLSQVELWAIAKDLDANNNYNCLMSFLNINLIITLIYFYFSYGKIILQNFIVCTGFSIILVYSNRRASY